MNLDEIDCKELLKRLLSYYGLTYKIVIHKELWNFKEILITDKSGKQLNVNCPNQMRTGIFFIDHEVIENEDYMNVVINLSNSEITLSRKKIINVMKYNSIEELIMKLDLIGA